MLASGSWRARMHLGFHTIQGAILTALSNDLQYIAKQHLVILDICFD